MERMTPEQMEKMVHEALRLLPNRRAPASLEARVHAALEARAAIPWWHRSWAYWPQPVRAGFLVLCGVVTFLMMLGWLYLQAGADPTVAVQALAPVLSGASRIMSVVRGIENYAALVVRHIPAVWLYGAIAFVAAVYAMLMGLGAAAYRTLWVHHA
jgi:hypothetical protein